MSSVTLHKIERQTGKLKSSSEETQNGAKMRFKKIQRYGGQRETLKYI